MKTDRLVAIIMLLLRNKKISATQLANRFEVSTRTIFRDMEALNLAGIPIVTYPGVYGGIGIMEEYKIDKSLFTPADVISLLIGLGGMASALSTKEISSTLEKLRSLVPAHQSEKIESDANQIRIDLTSWAGHKSLQPRLEKIRKALREKRLLSFHYLDKQGNKSRRQVEPYQLALKENQWYMQAYCLARRDFRTFKLSRILQPKILSSQFVPREFSAKPLDGSDWIDKRLITIKLLIDSSLRETLIERCGEENLKPYAKNKFLVDFPFVEDDWGYAILLGFGDRCECLAPERVRLELIRRIDRLASVYKKHRRGRDRQ